MITIRNIRNAILENYDEVWAVVRSPKQLPVNVSWVPELSPSWDLFKSYLEWRKSGIWNKETFDALYVPQFIKEMKQPVAREKLKELAAKSQAGKQICLCCFCTDETICHTSILAGILQSETEVRTALDYSKYRKLYGGQTEFHSSEIPSITGKGFTSMCLTGVRPNKLCGYERKLYKPFIEQLADILERYYEDGIRTWITGGAQGFDQLGFWAIDKVKQRHPEVKNILYIPFEGQERIWPKTGCFSQLDYTLMIKYADDVHYVDVTGEALKTKSSMVRVLYTRNEAMVDHADMVLALQNDNSWRFANSGGTAHCMQYAAEKGKLIHRLEYDMVPYLTITHCKEE